MNVSKKQRANAKRMRRTMTEAEKKLWHELRAHRLMGHGFRRQYPIRQFIVDFACPEHRLVIELDGSQHGGETVAAADKARTADLQADGWTVVRFWNDDVLKDMDGVCRHIVAVKSNMQAVSDG
ncbi:MAG: endonuclease domain-containing protein [Phyllobacteriaceae bacterium]|nr:endonuclease domain-containing protein [Phyllobacteriaceae bacterium]